MALNTYRGLAQAIRPTSKMLSKSGEKTEFEIFQNPQPIHTTRKHANVIHKFPKRKRMKALIDMRPALAKRGTSPSDKFLIK